MITKYIAISNPNCYCIYDSSNEEMIFSYKQEKISSEVSLVYEEGSYIPCDNEVLVGIHNEHEISPIVAAFIYGNQIRDIFFNSLFYGINPKTGRRSKY